MKKFVVVGMLLLFGSCLLATEARIEALGKTNQFFRDNIEVYGIPAYLFDYTNMALAELGNYNGSSISGSWASVNLKVVDALNIAIAGQRVKGDIQNISTIGTHTLGVKPINGLDILANYKLENISLGLGIYKSGNREYDKSVNTSGAVVSENETKAGVFGINLSGVMMPNENASLSASFGIDFNSYSSKQTVGTDSQTWELDGGTAINASVRGFLPYTEKIKFVPTVGFHTFSYKGKFTNSANSSSNREYGSISNMYLTIGAGLNYNLDDALVIAGLSFDYGKNTNESDTSRTLTSSTMSIPRMNLGVEKKISEKVTWRFGAQKVFGSSSSKDERSDGAYSEYSSNYGEDSSNLVSTGFGLKLGKFAMDGAVTNNTLFNGGYILSGLTCNLNYKLSITYMF